MATRTCPDSLTQSYKRRQKNRAPAPRPPFQCWWDGGCMFVQRRGKKTSLRLITSIELGEGGPPSVRGFFAVCLLVSSGATCSSEWTPRVPRRGSPQSQSQSQ